MVGSLQVAWGHRIVVYLPSSYTVVLMGPSYLLGILRLWLDNVLAATVY
jgi:hypothetical protein